MLVSGICWETSHKASSEDRINVAEKCLSVKQLAEIFLGDFRTNFLNNL